MSIQHAGVIKYVQITYFESAVNAHWNSFDSLEEAMVYFKKHLVNKPGNYGFVVIEKDFWKYIP